MISAVWVWIILLLWILETSYERTVWKKERQDLLNRLMANDYKDYRESIDEKPPPRGGNMVRAGLKKAANQEMQGLGGGNN